MFACLSEEKIVSASVIFTLHSHLLGICFEFFCHFEMGPEIAVEYVNNSTLEFILVFVFPRGQKETADAGAEWESILFWTGTC